MKLSQARFEAFILDAQPSARAHQKALPVFVAAAGKCAIVHFDAAFLSSSAGYQRDRRHEVVMLLASHSFNVFVDFVGTIFAGRFDAACYLARPMFDAAAILGYAGGDDAVAAQFRSDPRSVPASAARKASVAQLRAIDPKAADEVNRIFEEDAEAANLLAHLNLVQLDKLIEISGPSSQRATLGGRVDVEEATRMLRLAGYLELLNLSALRKVGEFGATWDDRCRRAIEAMMEWARAHPDETPAPIRR